MFDILFARTFVIVGAMLCLTAVTAKVNRSFETSREMWGSFIAGLAVLVLLLTLSHIYPLNLILVALFSLIIGWQVGPAIEHYSTRYKLRRYLKDAGTPLAKGADATPEQVRDFAENFDRNNYHKEWQNIVFQAFMGTALAVISAAGVVFLTDYDFSFLQGFLFICLCLLIVMGLVNAIFIRSKLVSLIRAYLGAVIFTLYLLYDFNRLEKHAGDDSWSTAIDISVGLYLDIINLFLDLLEILSESD